MGRFYTAECGYYLTTAMDCKDHGGQHYCIVDGGMNHLNYLGQIMGMNARICAILLPGQLPYRTGHFAAAFVLRTMFLCAVCRWPDYAPATCLFLKTPVPTLLRKDLVCF